MTSPSPPPSLSGNQMARPASTPFYSYFKITYPLEYVAHVEINRPDRLNAFIEPCALPPPFPPPPLSPD